MTVSELKSTLEQNGLNVDGDQKRLLDRCWAAAIATVKHVKK